LWLAAFLPLFAASVAVADEVVFALRQPKGPHWYENFGHAVTDVNRTAYGAGGRLCKLDLPPERSPCPTSAPNRNMSAK
jgi:hypothetical protein